MAAEELRYYVGELTGRPLPVVGPDQADDFTGTLYRIVDLSRWLALGRKWRPTGSLAESRQVWSMLSARDGRSYSMLGHMPTSA